jgi:hypothetical protein
LYILQNNLTSQDLKNPLSRTDGHPFLEAACFKQTIFLLMMEQMMMI